MLLIRAGLRSDTDWRGQVETVLVPPPVAITERFDEHGIGVEP